MEALKVEKGKRFALKVLEPGLAMLTVETDDVPKSPGEYWDSISTTLNEDNVRAVRDWCDEFLRKAVR